MRIRKRWPPPPLTPSPPPDLQSSTLQPLPSSAESPPLHHRNDLSVDDNNSLTLRRDSLNLSLRSPKETEDRRRPDLELVAISKTNGWICSNNDVVDEKMSVNQDPPIVVGEDETTAEEKTFIRIIRRMGNDPIVESSATSSISSPVSHQEHWCEEDKVFPVKKRRASFRSKVLKEATIMDGNRNKTINVREEKRKSHKKWADNEDDGNKTIVGERRKSNKKWADDEDDGNKTIVGERRKSNKKWADDEDEEDGVVKKENGKKRGGNGSQIREGWRCSRMNGRGWRCCQPTLVGYSLCEHHLGKGKLRSMNGVPLAKTNHNKVNTSLCLEDDDDEKGLVVAKRRKRIGIFKARSISCLLGQAAASPPPPPATL